MPDNNDQALRAAMARLLAGEAQRTDGCLTITNLAAEAGLTRQQAYRSPVIHDWQKATRDPPPTKHPDNTQARIDRLARDLTASRQRAQRYRQERDEARDQATTLANACRTLDEKNHALRTALADARVVSPLRHRVMVGRAWRVNGHGLRPAPITTQTDSPGARHEPQPDAPVPLRAHDHERFRNERCFRAGPTGPAPTLARCPPRSAKPSHRSSTSRSSPTS